MDQTTKSEEEERPKGLFSGNFWRLLFVVPIVLLSGPIWDGAKELGIPPLLAIFSLAWAFLGDDLLEHTSLKYGWLNKLTDWQKEELFRALCWSPLFGLCFSGAWQGKLGLPLSIFAGILAAFAYFVAMTALSRFLWIRWKGWCAARKGA